MTSSMYCLDKILSFNVLVNDYRRIYDISIIFDSFNIITRIFLIEIISTLF